jgi:hypothetical protein
MIWGDPWIAVATDRSGVPRRWCTTIPPPVPALPAGMQFRCTRVADIDLAEWRELVGTRWGDTSLKARLADTWIPCLHDSTGRLAGTCVLRPIGDAWHLETLCAIPGHGTLLMRLIMTWIWRHVGGPYILAYTWELTAAQLCMAWWRGWLQSAIAIEYGWSWYTTECGFCSNTDWVPATVARFEMPTLIQRGAWSVVVSDSGLGDGWGYVLRFAGDVDWPAVATAGGWRALWCHRRFGPKGWHWTGEFVVRGRLNQWADVVEEVPITAEVAPGHSSKKR